MRIAIYSPTSVYKGLAPPGFRLHYRVCRNVLWLLGVVFDPTPMTWQFHKKFQRLWFLAARPTHPCRGPVLSLHSRLANSVQILMERQLPNLCDSHRDIVVLAVYLVSLNTPYFISSERGSSGSHISQHIDCRKSQNMLHIVDQYASCLCSGPSNQQRYRPTLCPILGPRLVLRGVAPKPSNMPCLRPTWTPLQ
jgi:hypothetical protein